MIKKEHVKKGMWCVIILTNIVFWLNIYMNIELKAQRLVFQVNDLLIKDKRINKEKNRYIYANNQIKLVNLINGVKVSNIYAKEFSKVKPFKRYNCKSGDNILEYSRLDENMYYLEDATIIYQTRIEIPIMAIIKTFFVENQQITVNIMINDLPLPLNVTYAKYKHTCGIFSDWSVKL